MSFIFIQKKKKKNREWLQERSLIPVEALFRKSHRKEVPENCAEPGQTAPEPSGDERLPG